MFFTRQPCPSCNRSVNVSKEGGFTDINTQAFLCRPCFSQKLAAGTLDPDIYVQVQPKIRRPLIITALLKILMQIVFLQVGFESGDSVELVISLVFTGIFLFWTVSPFLLWIDARKKEESYQAWLIDVKKKYHSSRTKSAPAKPQGPRECPNCGAITHGTVCEYCGFPLE